MVLPVKTIPFGRLTMVRHRGNFVPGDGHAGCKTIFQREYAKRKYFQKRVNQIWETANWAWMAHGDKKLLHWH
jgi:hypothetical protein